MPVITAAAFFISLSGYYFGYGLFIRRNISFFPIFFTAYTVIVLYIFGLTGLLTAGFYTVLILGILMIPVAVVKKRSEIIPLIKMTLKDPSLLFIIAGTVWIYLITKGVSLSHTDDFTHWYRICKMMHFENAYPTKPDMIFPDYVPGTATWIWFITSITGFAPDKCFFAHSLINLAALNSFFSLGSIQKDKEKSISGKVLLFIFVSVLSVLLCSMDVNTYCLLTDTTIALIPMAAVFFVLSGDTPSCKTDSVLFTVLMCFESLIKIAGLPFFIFVCIFRIIHIKNSLQSSKLSSAAIKLLPAGIPFMFFYAYIIRAKIVFGFLENSEQGFSVTRYLSIFSQKSGNQIMDISWRFLKEMFDFFGVMTMQVRLLWVIFILLLIAFLITLKKDNRTLSELKKGSLALFIFFVVYSIFLLLTYLFSMNDREANAYRLNCFYRYMGSVTIFVYGIISYYLYRIFAKTDKRKRTLAVSALCLVSAAISICIFDIGFIAGFSHYHPTEIYTTGSWDLLNRYATENNYYTEESYFIIYREEDVKDCVSVKTDIASVVYFRSKNVYAVSTDYLRTVPISEENRDLLRNCDYLVTLGDLSDDLELIKEFVDIDEYIPGTMSLKEK
ncbi:MAG: hypothetical protein K6E72_06635 [Saccharofermentans sp.]|nr:hypothetical protein [Saccharofermentans sp.]